MSMNRSVRGCWRFWWFCRVSSLVAPARPARAFCGFYVAGSDAKLFNNATQVVLMRKGNRTVLSMQNNYQGPPESFAMVVPVPVVLQKEDVKTLPRDVFEHVDSLRRRGSSSTGSRTPAGRAMLRRGTAVHGCRGRAMDGAAAPRKTRGPRRQDRGAVRRRRVRDRDPVGDGLVGPRDLAARRSTTTSRRAPSRRCGRTSRQDRSSSSPRSTPKKVQRDAQGVVQLSPLRFHYDTDELALPVRLGLLNAGGKQDLIVYIIHPTSRFEVANYTNVIHPDELRRRATACARTSPRSTRRCSTRPSRRCAQGAVVTEYAWQTTACDPCPTPPLSLDDLVDAGPRRARGDRRRAEAPRDRARSTKPA